MKKKILEGSIGVKAEFLNHHQDNLTLTKGKKISRKIKLTSPLKQPIN